MLSSVYAHCQEIVDKRISSDAERIVIELDIIDHVELFNSDDDSEIYVRTEGPAQASNFQLTDVNGHVLLKDELVRSGEHADEIGKICIEEPDYTSYQIYLPQKRDVFISFMEGNVYATDFKGALDLKVENGIIELHDMKDPVKIDLNSGSVFVNGIKNSSVDAETSLGTIVNGLSGKHAGQPLKKLQMTTGDPDNKIMIRTILANIFLNGSKE